MSEEQKSEKVEMPEIVKKYFEVYFTYDTNAAEGDKKKEAKISEHRAKVVAPLLEKARALDQRSEQLVRIVSNIFDTSHSMGWNRRRVVGNEYRDPVWRDVSQIEVEDKYFIGERLRKQIERKQIESSIEHSNDPEQKKTLEEKLKALPRIIVPLSRRDEHSPYLDYLYSLGADDFGGFYSLRYRYQERKGSSQIYDEGLGKIRDQSAREVFETMLTEILPRYDKTIQKGKEKIAEREQKIKELSELKKKGTKEEYKRRVDEIEYHGSMIVDTNKFIDVLKKKKQETREMLNESLNTPYEDRALPLKSGVREMTAEEWDAQKDGILSKVGQYHTGAV